MAAFSVASPATREESRLEPAARSSEPVDPDLLIPAALRRDEFPAMGTRVSVLSAAGRSDALPLTRALFEEWESRLSRFQAGSELSRLNAGAGTPVVVSDLLAEVVATALSAAEASDGVYDPTLLPQLAALGYERSFELMESDQPAAAVASQPGGAWRGIRLDRQARIVELPVGAALDLGGIGKGLAVDSAIELLAAAGHRMAAAWAK